MLVHGHITSELSHPAN